MTDQQKVWDALAKVWKGYRQKPFRDVERLLSILLPMKKGKILELGCGNCRNLLPFAKQGFQCYGIDFSKEMLKFAREFMKKNKFKVKLKQARAEKLPFKNNSFDYILCIALLHHLDKEEQIKALNEIKRVIKPEAKAIITVWNKLNPKFWKFLLKKEAFVPWKINEITYKRYYYFFGYWELKKLLKKFGFKILYSSSPFARNIAFIIKKRIKENV